MSRVLGREREGATGERRVEIRGVRVAEGDGREAGVMEERGGSWGGGVAVGRGASAPRGLDGEALGKAAKDVEELDAAGRLRRPPELIVEGLLGTGGSARIAQLECAELQEGLGKVDEAIGDTAGHVGPYLAEWLGIESRARTHPVLHEAAGLVGDAPELTEGEASDWLFQFMRGAVLCVVPRCVRLPPPQSGVLVCVWPWRHAAIIVHPIESSRSARLWASALLVRARLSPSRGATQRSVWSLAG